MLSTPASVAQQDYWRTTVGDFDGDGDADILGLKLLGGTLQALRNDGRGRFTALPPLTLPGGGLSPPILCPLDADGDGDLDFLLTGASQTASLWLNNGAMAFAMGPPLPLTNNIGQTIAADLDGDGDIDLALAGSALASTHDRVLVNDGTGTFSLGPVLTFLPFGGGIVASGDVDNDGDVDLLFTEASMRLFRNDGGLTFTETTATNVLVPPQVIREIVPSDLDGDGDVDFLLRADGANDRVVINQNGVLTAGTNLPPKNPTNSISVADVDGDGDLDAMRGHDIAGISLALNDGTGQFADAPTRLPQQVVFSSDVQLADLDRDGDPDLVTSLRISPTLILRNRDVDLEATDARIGQTWSATLRCRPGYASQPHPALLVVGLAALPQPLSLPLGEWFVDPATPTAQSSGVIAVATGAQTFSFAVPNAPSIVGVSLEVQGLVDRAPGPARISAWQTVTIQQ
ncbi:MAG: FG-GAP repeat domain-containing protein [Planctomycetota bacterium]